MKQWSWKKDLENDSVGNKGLQGLRKEGLYIIVSKGVFCAYFQELRLMRGDQVVVVVSQKVGGEKIGTGVKGKIDGGKSGGVEDAGEGRAGRGQGVREESRGIGVRGDDREGGGDDGCGGGRTAGKDDSSGC